MDRAATAIGNIIFPSRCLACRLFYHPGVSEDIEPQASYPVYDFQFVDALRSFLCPTCINAYVPIQSPVCSKCGKPFESRQGEDHECEACITAPKYFTAARAPGVYDQSLMTLIHQLKYKGKIQLANPLGRFLFTALQDFWNEKDIDIIVPVPLHKKRFRKRGFNQSYLLIKDWKKISKEGEPGIGWAHIDRELLVRKKHTKPQTGLSRKDRVKNIKNAFQVVHPEKVKGKRLLIVDDVYTTGATTNECARILLKSKAERVDVLTLARAI